MFMSISRKFLFLHDIQLSIFGWNLIHWDSEKLFAVSYYTGNPAEKRISSCTVTVILTEEKCGKHTALAGYHRWKMLCFPHTNGHSRKMGAVILPISWQFHCHVDNPSAAFFRPHKGKKNFLPFAQRSEILFPGRPDCPGLVNGQPFQKPAVFLPGKVPYFRRIPGPLESPII